MSKNNFLYLFLAVLLTLVITGCNCDNEAVKVYEVLLDSPVGHVVVTTLNPTFSWHGSESCEPDMFDMYIHENLPYGGDFAHGDISGDATSYTLTGDSLLPGREYFWSMMAYNEYDPEESGDGSGSRSEKGFFHTGPVCSNGPLVAPDLEFPYDPGGNPKYDNWITHSGPQDFRWTYSGGCLPEYYDYQFATNPGFSDIVLSGTTTELYLMHLYETFPNCSSLFWRVAARVGSTVGPWSDVQQFHWVEDESCYQTHYLSDSGARIFVELFHDICESTGYHSTGATLDSNCVQWPDNYVTGNTIRDGSDYTFYDFHVDLGSGPCPSTGLDKKSFDSITFFNVLAPGTYCVSIDRDQIVGDGTGTSSLLRGAWTEPRTSDQVAGITIELGPGVQDVTLKFGWDEYDYPTLYYPIPENINCRVGPDPICDPLKIPMEGEILPIIARDRSTEWKLTSYEGEQCYVYLQSAVIDQTLDEIGPQHFTTADLPVFDPPPPCPTPTPEPRESGTQKACSEFTMRSTCPTDRCQWVDGGFAAASYCTNK